MRLDVPNNEVAYFGGAPIFPAMGPPIPQPFIQRLRGRTYLVAYNAFVSMVYRGNRGLLMVDCGGHSGAAELGRVLSGLAQIGGWNGRNFPPEITGIPPDQGGVPTPGLGLPLHTLVVTHPHADHCGHSVALEEPFPHLRVVGSRWYDDEVRLNKLPMARATRKIRRRFGAFFFEGRRFTFNTPVRAAHTTADSYVITPDKC